MRSTSPLLYTTYDFGTLKRKCGRREKVREVLRHSLPAFRWLPIPSHRCCWSDSIRPLMHIFIVSHTACLSSTGHLQGMMHRQAPNTSRTSLLSWAAVNYCHWLFGFYTLHYRNTLGGYISHWMASGQQRWSEKHCPLVDYLTFVEGPQRNLIRWWISFNQENCW